MNGRDELKRDSIITSKKREYLSILYLFGYVDFSGCICRKTGYRTFMQMFCREGEIPTEQNEKRQKKGALALWHQDIIQKMAEKTE